MPPLLSQGVQRPAAKTTAQKEKPRFVQDFCIVHCALCLPLFLQSNPLGIKQATRNEEQTCRDQRQATKNQD